MPSFPLAQSSAGVHTRAQPGVPMPAPSPSGLPDQLSGAGSPPTSPTGDPMKCSLSRYPLGRKGGVAVHSLNPHLALLSGTLGCWPAPVTRVFPQPAPPLPSVPTPPTNPAATPRGFSENPPYSEQDLTLQKQFGKLTSFKELCGGVFLSVSHSPPPFELLKKYFP